MLGSADTSGMPDVNSRRIFFRFELLCQNRPLEMKLEITPNFSHSEMRALHDPFCGMTLGRIFVLPFLCTSSVAAFRSPNSDERNGLYFAASRQVREIIGPEALHLHAAILNIRRDASTDGERCMKDTDHPVVHLSVHLKIFGRAQNRRSCECDYDQFGRGQNTGLGWSDPTFVHVSVPKVFRGVAPAQLRGDRAEYFVRAAFRIRRPQ